VVTPEHAYHVLEVMRAAQASERDGRVVEIKSRFTPPDFRGAARAEVRHDRIHDRRRA
jgi:hypothetical protein